MISGIHISKSEMVLQRQENKSFFFPELKENQVLEAKVVAKLGSGHVKLLVNGQEMEVKTNVSLNPGENIRLAVTKSHDSVTLKLIGSEKQEASQIVVQLRKDGASSLPELKENQVLEAKVLARLGPGQAKLLVNGQEVVVKTHLPLNPGGNIQLTVTETGESVGFKLGKPEEKAGKVISGVHISKSEMVLQRQSGQPLSLPDLKENQILEAKVLARLGPGQAKLLVNGQEVVVKTHVLLNPGEDIRLTVAEAKESIVLKLAGPVKSGGAVALAPLLKFFSNQTRFREIFRSLPSSLSSVLEETALKSGKRDEGFLPRMMTTGGLLWEKKLSSFFKTLGADPLDRNFETLLKQDAKGMALKLSGLEGKDLASGPASTFLETLENIQILNTQTSESGRYLLPFPILEQAGFNFGQILFDLGGKKEENSRGEKKNIRVSFLLDMTNLGPVRADFSILDKAITGRFLLENEEIRSFVQSMIPELRTRLAKIGHHLVKMDCMLALPDEIAPRVFMESLMRQEADQVVNIVI